MLQVGNAKNLAAEVAEFAEINPLFSILCVLCALSGRTRDAAIAKAGCALDVRRNDPYKRAFDFSRWNSRRSRSCRGKRENSHGSQCGQSGRRELGRAA